MLLFLRVIRGRLRSAPASAYHSITRGNGGEYWETSGEVNSGKNLSTKWWDSPLDS